MTACGYAGQVIVRDEYETSERLVQVMRRALPSDFLLELAEITEDARTSGAHASDASYITCPTSATSGSLAIRGVSDPVGTAPANAKGGQPGQRGLCAICGVERERERARERLSDAF